MTILNEPNKKPRSNYLRQTGLLSLVPGLLIAGPLVGFFIGQWIDGYFRSEPWGLIGGIVFGFSAAGHEIWKLVKKAEAFNAEDAKAEKNATSSSYDKVQNSPPFFAADEEIDKKKKDSLGHGPDH